MTGRDRHGGEREMRLGRLFARGRAALALAGRGDEHLHRLGLLGDARRGEREHRARVADLAHVRADAGRGGERGGERERQTQRAQGANSDGAPSPVHSARVGIDVEVHYRWHALYGKRVHLHYSEVRTGARLSYVEAASGVVIVLPSWMLDPGACVGMRLGAPQVDIVALKDLRQLLIDRGLRRSSTGDVRVAEEEQNEAFAQTRRNNAVAASHPAPTRDSIRLAAAVDDERAGASADRRVSGQYPDAGGGRRARGGQR